MAEVLGRMSDLCFYSLSLRYSSWSIRPWLALTAAGAAFRTETVELDDLGSPPIGSSGAAAAESAERLANRQGQGSVMGLFPVLHVDDTPIHESLAICEWAAETFPEAGLWPADSLARARARAVSSEMSSGFKNLRNEMACHVFARVPNFELDAATKNETLRVFEIWHESLAASGGPFLFGAFGVADCMYFPVLTRFRTYGVSLDADLEAYATRLEAHPAVTAWLDVANHAPVIAEYDQMIRDLGGDPEAARPTR